MFVFVFVFVVSIIAKSVR